MGAVRYNNTLESLILANDCRFCSARLVLAWQAARTLQVWQGK